MNPKNEKENQVTFDDAVEVPTEQPQAPEVPEAPVNTHNASALAVVTSGEEFRELMASMPAMERLAFLQSLGGYIGARTAEVNLFLNTRIQLLGVVQHMATVTKSDKDGNVLKFLDEHGEEVTKTSEAERTVFRIITAEGEPATLGFVSGSISRFAKEFLIPAFGVGDWEIPVPVVIRQVSTRNAGRAYNVQVVN